MDFGDKVQAIVTRIREDKDFKDKFFSKPVETLEEVLGINLPDEQVEAVVEKVKAKLADVKPEAEDAVEGAKDGAEDLGDKIQDAAESVVDKVKGFFNKD
ncbi:MAG: hypothetical protein EOM03_02370 [Clostridia bacterium]|nr:hypothetical protein [Clostridia bacterium]